MKLGVDESVSLFAYFVHIIYQDFHIMQNLSPYNHGKVIA